MRDVGPVPPHGARAPRLTHTDLWALALDANVRARWDAAAQQHALPKLEIAILAPELRSEVVRALSSSGVRNATLVCLMDAMQLKRTTPKAAAAQRIVDQCCRGVARGVTVRGDAPMAIYELVRSHSMETVVPFSKFWIHVHAGREHEFLANPCTVAREVWEHSLPESHGEPAGYFETKTALTVAMFRLYSESIAEHARCIDADRAWLTFLMRYRGADFPRFVGEQCWDARVKINRSILLHLKPRDMEQVFLERSAFRLLPTSRGKIYVGPNNEKVDYEYREILDARGPAEVRVGKELRGIGIARIGIALGIGTTTTATATATTTATTDTPSTATTVHPQPTTTAAICPPSTSAVRSNLTRADESSAVHTAHVVRDGAVPTGPECKDKDTMTFYARLQKADPMYEMISPKDNPSYPPGDLLPPQKVLPLKTFQQCFFLASTDLHFLQREDEFELQAVCMLQNDDVKERIQWPLDVYLTVNDSNLQVPRRSTIKSVTKSTRDPAVRVPASRLRAGSNHLRMFHRDKRGNFMLAVRIVRKRSFDDVAANIPKASSEALSLKNALKHFGFTKADDDIIMEDSTLFSLRCPISGQVFQTPARLSSCQGVHAFDATSFLQLNMVSRKWCCPECGKKGGPADLRVDSFIKRCTDTISERGLDKVSRIEIDKEGRWRPREEAGAPSLTADQLRWYAPTITGGDVKWTLEKADAMSPASTATKVTGDDTETPNVQSKQVARNGDEDADDSELDEEEEYKRAIREAAQFSGAVSTQPRKPKKKEPDVIVISDDDDDTPTAKRPRPQSLDVHGSSQGSAAKRPKPSSAFLSQVGRVSQDQAVRNVVTHMLNNPPRPPY